MGGFKKSKGSDPNGAQQKPAGSRAGQGRCRQMYRSHVPPIAFDRHSSLILPDLRNRACGKVNALLFLRQPLRSRLFHNRRLGTSPFERTQDEQCPRSDQHALTKIFLAEFPGGLESCRKFSGPGYPCHRLGKADHLFDKPGEKYKQARKQVPLPGERRQDELTHNPPAERQQVGEQSEYRDEIWSEFFQ